MMVIIQLQDHIKSEIQKNLTNENTKKLYLNITYRLNIFVNEYSDETHEMDIIKIMFIELNPLPKLNIRNINKLKLEKKLVKISETKKNFNNQSLPLTMNLKYFVGRLAYNTNSKGYIGHIAYKG
jgi:hypothetical protein